MDAKDFGNRLRTGRATFATLIVSTAPRWMDVIESLGLDFIFIDTEHVSMDRAQLSWMCQAYRRAGLPVLCRATRPDPYEVTMLFDGGATAVVAPYVESVDQVRELIMAAKFRPLKGRRVREALQDPKSLEPELARYVEDRNKANTLLINIESVPALEQLDAMLAYSRYIDGLLIGPHDLSCSLGVPEQYDHPKFDAAVRLIIAKARAAGVGAGIHIDNPEIVVPWLKAGMNFLIQSSDVVVFATAMRGNLARIRAALDPQAKPTQGRAPAVHI